MATLNRPENEEDQQNQGGNEGTPISGTAGASDAGNPNPGAGNSPVKQDAAAQNQSGYTDVGSYLNANLSGSQNMGNQVASNLTNKYNQTKQGVTQSANDLINQVNQGYTQENADLIKQASADPNAVANNQDQLAAFQGQLNDTYSGPQSWADFGTQQGKVNEAQQYGNLNNTPGGYNVLAQELEGPQASQGVNQLDALLLQGNQGSASAIKAAADPYQSLNDFLNQQNQAGTQAIQGGQNAAQTASQHALDAFTGQNGTLTNLNNTINSNTSSAVQEAQKQQAAIQKALSGLYSSPVDTKQGTIQGYGGVVSPYANTTNYSLNNTITPEIAQQLGMSQDQWSQLQQALQQAGTSEYFTGHNFGAGSPTSQIDLSQYLSQQDPTTAINAGTVATPEQYAQMAAIQKLLGDKTPQGGAINPALASLAGTAPSTNQFNYDAALSDAQNTAKAERDYAKQMAASLTASADQQHAASQHGGGFFGGLTRNLMNPGQLIEGFANPLSQTSSAMNLLTGKQVNPNNYTQPGAKLAGTAIGGIVGGIYGGPAGAAGGATAGGLVGGEAEDLGNKNTKDEDK